MSNLLCPVCTLFGYVLFYKCYTLFICCHIYVQMMSRIIDYDIVFIDPRAVYIYVCHLYQSLPSQYLIYFLIEIVIVILTTKIQCNIVTQLSLNSCIQLQ